MKWGNIWEVQGEAPQELGNLAVSPVAEAALGGSVLDQLVQTGFSRQLLNEILKLFHAGVLNRRGEANPGQCEVNNLYPIFRHSGVGANWDVAENINRECFMSDNLNGMLGTNVTTERRYIHTFILSLLN